MADKRLPKERVFTPEDVDKALREGKVYDPTLVDFVPLELPVEQAELLTAAGWKAPALKKPRPR